MSDNYWLGAATAVAQVTTVQVTAYDIASTYKLTVGTVVLSVIAAGSVNATATALAAAWNASTHNYFTGVTALASTDTVTLTADTAGVPFVVTSSKSGGTGTIGAASTTTTSAGPNDWSTAANWSLGVIPANGDNVWIKNSSIPILWGLAQSGVTPALLVVEQTFTGTLGLPYGKLTRSLGSYDTTVPEYRASFLAIGAAAVRIGENYGGGAPAGAALIKIDLGSTNSAVQVYNTGQATDGGGMPPVRVKLNHASATLKLYAGKVGLCWEVPGETGQASQIDVYAGGGSPEIYVGSGVTLATHNQHGGLGLLRNAPTTVRSEVGARVTLAGSGTITTLEKRGELVMAGSYTVTTLKG